MVVVVVDVDVDVYLNATGCWHQGDGERARVGVLRSVAVLVVQWVRQRGVPEASLEVYRPRRQLEEWGRVQHGPEFDRQDFPRR